MTQRTLRGCATAEAGNFIPTTRSTDLPFDSVTSSRRQASVPRMISAGGYHLNGSAATSALYPDSTSARRRPSTCDSAPPVVKGTCVVQMSTLRTDMQVSTASVSERVRLTQPVRIMSDETRSLTLAVLYHALDCGGENGRQAGRATNVGGRQPADPRHARRARRLDAAHPRPRS